MLRTNRFRPPRPHQAGHYRDKKPKGWPLVRFFARTAMLGAVADVLHYVYFSRLIAEAVNLICGIPFLVFFGDFGAPDPLGLTQILLAVSLPLLYQVGYRTQDCHKFL